MELIWLLALLGACAESLDWARNQEPTRAVFRGASEEWRSWLRNRIGDGSGDGSGDGDVLILDVVVVEFADGSEVHSEKQLLDFVRQTIGDSD